jgi:hypothetical protein
MLGSGPLDDAVAGRLPDQASMQVVVTVVLVVVSVCGLPSWCLPRKTVVVVSVVVVSVCRSAWPNGQLGT